MYYPIYGGRQVSQGSLLLPTGEETRLTAGPISPKRRLVPERCRGLEPSVPVQPVPQVSGFSLNPTIGSSTSSCPVTSSPQSLHPLSVHPHPTPARTIAPSPHTNPSVRFIHPVTLKPPPASHIAQPLPTKANPSGTLDTPPSGTVKSILPCTPLAIVKVLEHIGVYNKMLEYGDRARGKVITVINR